MLSTTWRLIPLAKPTAQVVKTKKNVWDGVHSRSESEQFLIANDRNKQWTTLRGYTISYSGLENTHLVNIVNMLVRRRGFTAQTSLPNLFKELRKRHLEKHVYA